MAHLALDEIGIYLDRVKVTDVESRYLSLYDYLSDEVSKVPPGANGVIFTPWLHGNRCPFEDSNAGGMSPVTCQMLADITGRTIETVGNSQEVGAVGTALVVAAGIKGEDVLTLAKRLVKVNRVYQPDASNKAVYEKNHRVFKRLYHSNARNFSMINGG